MDVMGWKVSTKTVIQSAFYSTKQDNLIKCQYSISGDSPVISGECISNFESCQNISCC